MSNLEMSDIRAAFPAEDIELLKMVAEFLENEGACEAFGDLIAYRPFAQIIFDEHMEVLHGKNDELEKKMGLLIERRTGRDKTLSPLTLYALTHLLWGWCDINRSDKELRSCLYPALLALRNAMASEVERALAKPIRFEKTMTPAQVAEMLDVSTDTLAKWRSQGRGPGYYPLGGEGTVRYNAAAAREWLETHHKTPEGEGR